MPDTRSGSIEVLHLSKQFLQRETGLTLDVLNDISFCAEPGTFLRSLCHIQGIEPAANLSDYGTRFWRRFILCRGVYHEQKERTITDNEL